MTLVKPPGYAYYPEGEPVPTVEEASHPLFDFSDYTNVRKLARAIALKNGPKMAALLSGELSYAYRTSDYNQSALIGFISNFDECFLIDTKDTLYPLIKDFDTANIVAVDIYWAIDAILCNREYSEEEQIPTRKLLERESDEIDSVALTTEETSHPFLELSNSDGPLFGNIMSLARSIAAHNPAERAGLLSGEMCEIYNSREYDCAAISQLFLGLAEREMLAVLDIILPLEKENVVAMQLALGLNQAVVDTRWSDMQHIPLDVLTESARYKTLPWNMREPS